MAIKKDGETSTRKRVFKKGIDKKIQKFLNENVQPNNNGTKRLRN